MVQMLSRVWSLVKFFPLVQSVRGWGLCCAAYTSTDIMLPHNCQATGFAMLHYRSSEHWTKLHIVNQQQGMFDRKPLNCCYTLPTRVARHAAVSFVNKTA